MADADTKAEIKKAILEFQSLGVELNNALDRATEEIEANKLIGSELRDMYERVCARSDEILAQIDRLQDELKQQRLNL